MSEPNFKWAKSLGLITSIPLLILISVGIGLFAGIWLDGKFHSNPWFTIILIILGLAAGLYESAKLLIDVTREDRD
ncbi:MAG: AtpZ/AtpI family protein [Armatimonadetes bacterium]|nr:AtpZ/AtpI family protein [Armatimonadota bacterium]